MPEFAERDKLIADILKDACQAAYWHGELSGDHDMAEAHKERWFRAAVERIQALYKH